MLALAETDLVVARLFCTSMSPPWLEGLSEIGKTLILERLTMLVAVDPQDRWYVRYQDFSVSTEQGADGDYLRMQGALANPYFKNYRCLKFMELPPQLSSTPKPCEWKELLEQIDSSPEGSDKEKLLEACGQTISRLHDIEQRDLLNGAETGELALVALRRFQVAQNERLVKARQLGRASQPTEVDLRNFARTLDFLGADTPVLTRASSRRGEVQYLQLGHATVLYVSHKEGGGDRLPMNRLYSFEQLKNAANQGAIEIGFSELGSTEVFRLEGRQLEMLDRLLLERRRKDLAPERPERR